MKTIIIDDEKAMHLILKRMLGKIGNIEVVGTFQDTNDAYSFLQENKVDLVFLDISMPWESGLDFARRLRDNGWKMKLVFVTSHKEYALPAFDVYAYDYIVKPLSQVRLNRTIERILSEHQSEESAQKTSLMDPLTKRESQIIRLIGDGLTNKEIAETLHLTEGTVKNHVVNIFDKLQVKNRVQATMTAKELGITE